MAGKKKRTDPKLLLRWVVALCAMFVIMAALAVVLKRSDTVLRAPRPDPTPSAPEANPYGPEDFAYDENGYLTCLAGNSIPGIDVSSHQGQIDWEAVKASGIRFAIIRLGYRGYNSGTLHTDEMALQNLSGAKAAGLKIGAYFFSQAITTEEARAEAHHALQVLGGMALDLPLVYDWEFVSESARTGSVTSETLMACIHAFCDEVERQGYEPMVYFNQSLAKDMLQLEYLTRYPFWLAMYSDQMTYPYKIRFWQYSDQGSIPGITGNVDLDLYFP